MIEQVRPIALDDIEDARERIAGNGAAHAAGQDRRRPATPKSTSSSRTFSRPTPTRSAARRMRWRGLSDEERARGVWTISAGNAGQGVAYAARAFGVPCSVVAIETAPQTKLDRMRALGATIVPVSYETAWQARRVARASKGMEGTFIHPFDNHDFIAGHGTMGLEIVEDAAGRAHGHRRDRRRRADHRRRQRDQGAAAGRQSRSAPSRKRPRPSAYRWRTAARASFPTGRLRSSTAPAARASPRACGSGCSRVVDGAIIVTLDADARRRCG